METLINKETLQSKLASGVGPAVDFLYNNYSSMLYGYVLQFIPNEEEAEKVLMLIFGKLAARLQEACTSALSVYCWMQVEARKVILEYKKQAFKDTRIHTETTSSCNSTGYFFTLLQEASDEHRLVFSELFLNGRDKEELARQLQRNVHDITRLLKESLLIMRKNLQ